MTEHSEQVRRSRRAGEASPQVAAPRTAASAERSSPRGELSDLSAALNQSPRVRALAQLQQAADRSPRVAQLAALAAQLQGRPAAASTAQRHAPVPCSPVAGTGAAQRQGAAEAGGVAQLWDRTTETPNRTGLPDALKAGIEARSGLSMDDVRVHRGSPKPAQLQALAYAQGTDIHLGPGQEHHLPHEAWHVVQQKQGRVRPTSRLGPLVMNLDSALEREANQAFAPDSSIRAVDDHRQSTQDASRPGNVLQAVLRRNDREALYAFVRDYMTWVEDDLQQKDLNVFEIAPPFAPFLPLVRYMDAVVERAEQMDDLLSAQQYIVQQGDAFIRGSLSASPRDPLFSAFESQLQPPRAQMERAGLLQDAVLATRGSPQYAAFEGGVSGASLMQRRDVRLNVYRRLHRTIQRILFNVNKERGSMPMSHDANIVGDKGLAILNGHDMLGTVGRLSMMIEESDFLPTSDTRDLPMNWTSKKMIDERAKVFEYEDENKNRIKDMIDRHGEGRRDLSIPTTKIGEVRHEIKLRTGEKGALRLDFSDARRILDQVSPATTEDDLSYENIVRFLKQESGAYLNMQVRTGYGSPHDVPFFIRELIALLLGVEGTQNNVMALHAPMVTDLVGQRILDWSQALFTGGRGTDLDSIPAFAFAADKNQKGSSNKSEGPMGRQMRLVRDGSFDVAARAEDQDRLEAMAFNREGDRFLKENSEIVDRRVAELEQTKDYQTSLNKKKKEENKEQFRQTSRYKVKQEFLLENKIVSKEIPVRKSDGYITFQDAYMERQLQTQNQFFEEIFPQIKSLYFSKVNREDSLNDDDEVDSDIFEFIENLMERYLLQRFYGDEWRNRADQMHRERDEIDELRKPYRKRGFL